LWSPVGPEELALIVDTGMRAFPLRLPEQPIFYPVLSEECAIRIAREWNVRDSGSGYVTRFAVRRDFLDAYRVEEAGGRAHREYGSSPKTWWRSTALSSARSRSRTAFPDPDRHCRRPAKTSKNGHGQEKGEAGCPTSPIFCACRGDY
jgi:hypothetical protein